MYIPISQEISNWFIVFVLINWITIKTYLNKDYYFGKKFKSELLLHNTLIINTF